MKRVKRLPIILVISTVVIGYGLWSLENPAAQDAPAPTPPVTPTEKSVEMTGADKKTDAQKSPSKTESEAWKQDQYPAVGTPVSLDAAAVESLRQTRLHGDQRTPPIVRDETPKEEPTEAELADPEQYATYEARQHEKLMQAFLKAADSEVEKIRKQLAEGERAGLQGEALRESREKLEKLEAMREQLRSGTRNPDKIF